MVEQSGYLNPAPQESPGSEAIPSQGLTPETVAAHAAYLKLIDSARIAVAVGMAAGGVGFVLCEKRIIANGPWSSVFGTGVLMCLLATLALIVERLVRPEPQRLPTESTLLRAPLVMAGVIAACFGMSYAFGCGEGLGTAIGLPLALVALRTRGIARIVPAVLAVFFLGWTLLSTQSPYQFARWRADAIVAAGLELMDRCPSSEFHTCEGRYSSYKFFGKEIDPRDSRVPPVLRRLRPRRIWVDEDRVAVYVGVNPLDCSVSPGPDVEFQIYRTSTSEKHCGWVWGSHGKGSTRINDRLWTNLY
jgi:hypothetical protein